MNIKKEKLFVHILVGCLCPVIEIEDRNRRQTTRPSNQSNIAVVPSDTT